MQNIAIIPARGGSKRVPLKNIKEFAGIPMLTRTLDTAIRSECFDEIVVSTDSDEIATIASASRNCKVEWRDSELAKDDANTVDVIASVLDELKVSDIANICCIYAPNPFLLPSALKLGKIMLETTMGVDYVSPVTTYPFPIQRSLSFEHSTNLISMTSPEYLLRHSQSLEPRFHETAQFWWAKGSTWKDRKPMQIHMAGIYTPRWMCQDIDTLEDWKVAELKWKILNEDGSLGRYEFTQANILNRENFFE